MADDDNGGDAQPTRSRRKNTSRRKSAAKRGRKSAASQRKSARRKKPARNVDEDKLAEHAPESDRTVEGGRYVRDDGVLINAHGTPLDEDTGEALDGDALETAEEERLERLDELADQEA